MEKPEEKPETTPPRVTCSFTPIKLRHPSQTNLCCEVQNYAHLRLVESWIKEGSCGSSLEEITQYQHSLYQIDRGVDEILLQFKCNNFLIKTKRFRSIYKNKPFTVGRVNRTQRLILQKLDALFPLVEAKEAKKRANRLKAEQDKAERAEAKQRRYEIRRSNRIRTIAQGEPASQPLLPTQPTESLEPTQPLEPLEPTVEIRATDPYNSSLFASAVSGSLIKVTRPQQQTFIGVEVNQPNPNQLAYYNRPIPTFVPFLFLAGFLLRLQLFVSTLLKTEEKR